MSERYINNLTGDFSICFSEHLTEHPSYLLGFPPFNKPAVVVMENAIFSYCMYYRLGQKRHSNFG